MTGVQRKKRGKIKKQGSAAHEFFFYFGVHVKNENLSNVVGGMDDPSKPSHRRKISPKMTGQVVSEGRRKKNPLPMIYTLTKCRSLV